MIIYDKIGNSYTAGRQEDPVIASKIQSFLQNAGSIVNLGAGTGSYEPKNTDLIAIDPSIKMLNQRPSDASLAISARAEALPFRDEYFSHAMTILSMHHWSNRDLAYSEIKRVVRNRFIAVTWNPSSPKFWLTRDYFPEVHTIDQRIFPTLTELESAFPGIRFYPLPIPARCADGFTAAYWARPHTYLLTEVRACMSTFRKISNVDSGLSKLKEDLDTGKWMAKNGQLLSFNQLNVGYTIAVWDKP